MTQFMIDCNMRTIIPAIHKEMDRETILNAVRIVGANHLTIATKNILPWKMLLKHQAIKQNTVFGKLSKTVAETFDKERRAGILIIDWNAGHNDPAHMAMMTMLAREFPRTIVYASHKEIMPRQGELLPKHQSFKPEKFRWMELTQILFPEMPNDCSRSCRDFFHAHIHRPTWKVRHVDDLCMLYNTFLPRIILGKDVVG